MMHRWLVERPAIRVYNKRRKLPAFLGSVAPGIFFAVDPIDVDVAGMLADAGELLPAGSADGAELSLVNLTPAYPCVDLERSEGTRLPNGRLIYAERFNFVEDKLPHQSLFKDGHFGMLFALERDDIAPDRNFKSVVESAGLRGLDFHEVWNSSDGPVGGRRGYPVD